MTVSAICQKDMMRKKKRWGIEGLCSLRGESRCTGGDKTGLAMSFFSYREQFDQAY